MPRHTIETPVTDYTGTVAGVRFTAGRGETDNENAVAYFQRQGYTVTPAEDDVEPDELPVDDPPVAPAPLDEAPVENPSAEPEGTKRASRRTPAK
ncbi:hypothetical protein [Amycolatopsis sp. CA-230715]|uniref:hypothetical protein n=1 Tax=Amycolatopsis sp. CA-230715 TaxID=2745196 RepID=UPI001C022978|nr:hypothetical protein [Amycolatopsis sp. CA-230715]QWF80143.1 hypothetical protein HUW46_03561 [Amycolatopsis sp. CA-230715]